MNLNAERNKLVVLNRLLRLLLLACGVVYLAVCIGCASCQRRMIYFPQKFTPQQMDQMAQSANLERWTNAIGEFVGLKRPSPALPVTGQLLIVYGNGSYAAGCAHYSESVQQSA